VYLWHNCLLISNKKLPFGYSLPELGFAKLKDLILSMSDKIRIDNKSNNHPFAILINPELYRRSLSDSEEFNPMPNKFPGFSTFGRQSSDIGIQNKMMHGSQDYDIYNKYNQNFPMNPTNYYPVYPNYPQQESRRNESSSSFQSIPENPNANRNNDSTYIPQANSLYGSQVNHQHLNISHCRNNTGSDIGYDNTFPITFSGMHKPGNLSHDFNLNNGYNTNKIWMYPNRRDEDLIEINSSGFLSENSSIYGFARSRSTSPKEHARVVSNLYNPNYGNEPNLNSSNAKIHRISEEQKSEEENPLSFQEMEDIIAPIFESNLTSSPEIEQKRQESISDFKEVTNEKEAPQQAKPTVPKQIHPNTVHSKLVPTSKIFLPSNKNSTVDKQSEKFTQNIVSASRLKAKTDNLPS